MRALFRIPFIFTRFIVDFSDFRALPVMVSGDVAMRNSVNTTGSDKSVGTLNFWDMTSTLQLKIVIKFFSIKVLFLSGSVYEMARLASAISPTQAIALSQLVSLRRKPNFRPKLKRLNLRKKVNWLSASIHRTSDSRITSSPSSSPCDLTSTISVGFGKK